MEEQELSHLCLAISRLEPFPPGNPFNHELYLMGHNIGKDLVMMYENHPDEEMKYFILVSKRTGERVEVTIKG
jgi:hypothetical protein